MCGIAGFWGLRDVGHSEIASIARHMSAAIAHRGPDADGQWVDAEGGIALAHRRLSIIDLSAAGAQPMISSCGRYILVFNGEIYNHTDMRKDLLEQTWRGHSDTETLLTAFATWGVEKTLQRTIGMFAFALWDRRRQELTLARDRMGEKPLYYGWQGTQPVFLFGSELKALQRHPAFTGEVDRRAMCMQLRHSYIPAPYSIYKGIHKLLPGHILKLKLGDEYRGDLPPSRAYWSLSEAVERGRDHPFQGSPEDAVEVLDALLRDAVGRQMMADVSLGAFLSGGVDSSLIVAMMQAQAARPVKTFTIGFNEVGYNEAVHAKAVAAHLGTDHTELYLSSAQAMDVIPKLPTLYDEPFSDSSQIPTFLVSQLAQRDVTVSLSGDGGDELFGGYSRYFRAERAWGTLDRLPLAFRATFAKAIRSVSVENWNRLAAPIAPLLRARSRNLGDKAHKLSDLMNERDISSFYQKIESHWSAPSEIVLGGDEPPDYFPQLNNGPVGGQTFEAMMYADSLSYLPDDILTKVDRAAMGTSLETRVPMLDHRVVEFAWRLPHSHKVQNGTGKWVLRQLLQRYVPRELIDRPKMGFGVPIDSWLRGPLRDWGEHLLDAARLKQEGYYDSALIRERWGEHLLGHRNWQYSLWNVLMFQSWQEHNKLLNISSKIQ